MGTLARQLKKAMADREMTQGMLEGYSKVDQPSISRILRGQNENPGVDTLIPLARALHVSLDWLVLGIDPKESPMLPPDEDELLAAYRSASADVREIMLMTVRSLSGKKSP